MTRLVEYLKNKLIAPEPCIHGVRFEVDCPLCQQGVGKDEMIKCRTCGCTIPSFFAFLLPEYEHKGHMRL